MLDDVLRFFQQYYRPSMSLGLGATTATAHSYGSRGSTESFDGDALPYVGCLNTSTMSEFRKGFWFSYRRC